MSDMQCNGQFLRPQQDVLDRENPFKLIVVPALNFLRGNRAHKFRLQTFNMLKEILKVPLSCAILCLLGRAKEAISLLPSSRLDFFFRGTGRTDGRTDTWRSRGGGRSGLRHNHIEQTSAPPNSQKVNSLLNQRKTSVIFFASWVHNFRWKCLCYDSYSGEFILTLLLSQVQFIKMSTNQSRNHPTLPRYEIFFCKGGLKLL